MPKSKPTILWSLCQLMYLMQICFLNTYRVYPKRIRTFKDSWDVGVQGEDRICSYIIWTEKRRRPSVYKGQLGWEKGREKRRLAMAGGMGKAVPPSWLADHRSNTPTRWKDCSSFAEALVINEAGVDGEGTHKQDEVAAFKEHLPYLGGSHNMWWNRAKSPSRLQDPFFHSSCTPNCLSLIPEFTSFSTFFMPGRFSLSTIQRAKRNISSPWPTSPNMTANRKGKVMMV